MSTPDPARKGPFNDNSRHSGNLVHFVVQALADPAALSRVVEFFALQNILPELVRARRFVDGELVIDIKVRNLDESRSAVIANKLGSCVLVSNVTVEVLAVGRDSHLVAPVRLSAA